MGPNTPTLQMADASTNVRGFQDIPHFQIEEIQRVLKQMSSRKTGAVDGVAGKNIQIWKCCFTFMPMEYLQHFTAVCMLDISNFPESW